MATAKKQLSPRSAKLVTDHMRHTTTTATRHYELSRKEVVADADKAVRQAHLNNRIQLEVLPKLDTLFKTDSLPHKEAVEEAIFEYFQIFDEDISVTEEMHAEIRKQWLNDRRDSLAAKMASCAFELNNLMFEREAVLSKIRPLQLTTGQRLSLLVKVEELYKQRQQTQSKVR